MIVPSKGGEPSNTAPPKYTATQMHSDDLARCWRSGSSPTVVERHGHAQATMTFNRCDHACPSVTGRGPESGDWQGESSKH